MRKLNYSQYKLEVSVVKESSSVRELKVWLPVSYMKMLETYMRNQSYIYHPVFILIDVKSHFLTKKLPSLPPFAGGYEICRTNFTST